MSDLGVDPALDLVLDALDGWIQAVGERVDETIRVKPADMEVSNGSAQHMRKKCSTSRQRFPSIPAPPS